MKELNLTTEARSTRRPFTEKPQARSDISIRHSLWRFLRVLRASVVKLIGFLALVVFGAVVASCTAPRARFTVPTSSPTATVTATVTTTATETWLPGTSPTSTPSLPSTGTPFPTPPVICTGVSCTITITFTQSLVPTASRTVSRTLTPTPTITPLGGGTPTLTPFVLYDEPFCPDQPYVWGVTGSNGGTLAAFDDTHVQPSCTCSPEAHSGIFSIAVWANLAWVTLSGSPTPTITFSATPTGTLTPVTNTPSPTPPYEQWEAGYMFWCPPAGTPCGATPTAYPTACTAFTTGAGVGRDLTGYNKLEIWARGLLGGEAITFGYGFGNDSAQNQTVVVLTQAYQKVTVPIIGGADMSHIAGVFWWRSSAGAPQTFYVDRIVYTND